jgi:phosphoribosylformylglycinamidine synthase I
MKAAVITFPGSNCDRDLAVAFEGPGFQVDRVWHKDSALPAGTDVVGIPGGFSFGDYLRCGAIAAQSPISGRVRAHAEKGGYVLGICNGFQVLTEMGLLPGVLMRNATLKFVCKRRDAEGGDCRQRLYQRATGRGRRSAIPIAHHDGNYTIDDDGLARLKGEDRIAFTYAANPNGSMADIAGVLSENRRVLGMMPHPERATEAALGGTDGSGLFRALMGGMALA